MAKTITINGVDKTDLFKEKGYVVGEKKILGNNSGVMLSGRQLEDVIGIKDTLKLPIEPLSEAELIDLMRLIREDQSAPYVEIYYFSTNHGAYRTAMFLRDEISNKHMFTSNKGVDYYEENTLDFTEQ